MDNESNAKKVIAYTKGSGRDKDDECAWSFRLNYVDSEIHDEKKDSFRMEMYAVLNALKAIQDKELLTEIRSNNEVIVKICRGEYKNNSDDNEELWDDIKSEISKFKKVYFTFVPKSDGEKNLKELGKIAHNKTVE